MIRFLALTVMLLTGGEALSTPGDTPFFVSVDWLSHHLHDAHLVLLHVGKREEFDAGHIPGARFASLAQVSAPQVEGGLVLELPAAGRLDSALDDLGIDDDSRIIVYFGNDWLSPTARLYLTLTYAGLGEHTSILDGGMPAWQSAGHGIDGTANAVKRGTVHVKPARRLVATKSDVLSHGPHTLLIDARTPVYYTGEKTSMSGAGHIPSARNIPFTSLFSDDGSVRDRRTLDSLFTAAGVAPGDSVITYCHIGQQASVVYVVARMLGHPARLYDGSFDEWSRDPTLPVVKGP